MISSRKTESFLYQNKAIKPGQLTEIKQVVDESSHLNDDRVKLVE